MARGVTMDQHIHIRAWRVSFALTQLRKINQFWWRRHLKMAPKTFAERDRNRQLGSRLILIDFLN
ncbi:Uncharacterised protein [Vibrio cholerae]|uniref:Uncharacterized protein n=1 Tax=Vibrio cholerae TaxID=666 RepID=A0A655SWQ5_VIBCL|nr:Uncharacterised protein [Vibrio cholerae]CSB27960.1 Uncharacterised protein [Vibrio cholerae]CSI45136.1 Uncharacterised protein [Vibrio cholerae]